jgi:NUMOD4 motif
MTEHWRPVPGWEGWYEVSDRGRVRSVDRLVVRTDGRRCEALGQNLRLQLDRGWLKSVILQRPGERRHCYVHRLQAQAFGDEAAAA